MAAPPRRDPRTYHPPEPLHEGACWRLLPLPTTNTANAPSSLQPCGKRQKIPSYKSCKTLVLRNEASTSIYSARLMEINTTLKTRLFIGGDSMPRKSSIARMKEGSNAVEHEAAFYECCE